MPHPEEKFMSNNPSIVRRYLVSTLIFGTVMGVVFPLYVSLFVKIPSGISGQLFTAGCIAAGIIVGVVSYLICRQMILKNINLIAQAIVDVQEKGDLTVVTRINSNDALGKLNNSFNMLIERFQSIISSIKKNTKVLTGQADDLGENAHGMDAVAIEMQGRCSKVDGGIRQTREEIEKISSNSSQMSESVQTVSSAAEELSSSFREVASNCQQSSQMTNKAKEFFETTRQVIVKFVETSKNVSGFLNTITAIADKTNLLAISSQLTKDVSQFRCKNC